MVVGGIVVVVVGGEVVVVGDAETEVAPWFAEDGSVVGGEVTVVEVLGGEVTVVGVCGAGAVDAVPPGCSLATTRPMTMVAPVAAKVAPRVRTRRDAWARRRLSGEWDRRVGFINHYLESAPPHANDESCIQPFPHL